MALKKARKDFWFDIKSKNHERKFKWVEPQQKFFKNPQNGLQMPLLIKEMTSHNIGDIIFKTFI